MYLRKHIFAFLNEKVLNYLKKAHPIMEKLLEYRKLDKLLNTYVIPLQEYAKKDKNHKIYTSFLQTGTSTGRLSSKNPNLQNIPTSTEINIRNALIAEKEFVSLDYSQIELRLLAHFSKDEHLINAFLEDKDIHLETAVKIFGEEKAKEFRNNKYLKDVLKVAKEFKEYFKIGKGVDNFLTFNTLLNLDGSYEFVEGFSKNFEFEDKIDPYEIVEYHDYAYYKKEGGFKPLELEELEPLNRQEFESQDKKYSWSKAPRYKGSVVEVGPSAQVINTYLSGKNQKLNEMVDKLNKELDISIKDYNSVMGRHLSRVIVSNLIIDKLLEDAFRVDEGELGFVPLQEVPSNAKGIGLTEATRGALAHFIDIGDNGYIRNYEMVVPTTWNISPKDDKDISGALESMLKGTKIKDEKNPIEIARVIRSTDPCLACAVH